jgi:hypothetical protein
MFSLHDPRGEFLGSRLDWRFLGGTILTAENGVPAPIVRAMNGAAPQNRRYPLLTAKAQRSRRVHFCLSLRSSRLCGELRKQYPILNQYSSGQGGCARCDSPPSMPPTYGWICRAVCFDPPQLKTFTKTIFHSIPSRIYWTKVQWCLPIHSGNLGLTWRDTAESCHP